jgi:hypothetical protein
LITVFIISSNLHKIIDSKIIIEMSTQVALVVNERESSTTIDFLSLSGGFLGLFAGFSVLSAAEIVYFFIISPVLEYFRGNSTRVHPFEEEESEVTNEGKVTEYIKEMLQESSIHSFNHIGNDQKSFVERWGLFKYPISI